MDWLVAQVQHWGYYALFLLTFLETSAFLGLVVPGETVVVLAGFLAWQGVLELGHVMWVVAAGAIAGDSVGYWLGRRYGEDLLRRTHTLLFEEAYYARTREFIDRYGGKTIFFGRFVGWFRSFGPFVAGAARLPYPRFLFFDLYGAVLWMFVFTLLGYLAGNRWEAIKGTLGKVGAAAAVLIVLLVLGAWFLRQRRRLVRRQLGRLDRLLSARLPRAWDFAKDRFRPSGWYGLSVTAGVLVLLLSVSALAGIVEDLLNFETLAAIDLQVRAQVEQWLSPALTGYMIRGINAGVFYVLAISLAALALYVWRQGEPALLAHGALAVGVGALMLIVLKALFREANLANFPSGYAYMAILVYGYGSHLAYRRVSGEIGRFLIYSLAGALTLLIGFGQIYLGVHWLTDVLAGYLAGFAWLVFATLLAGTVNQVEAAGRTPTDSRP